MFFGRKYLWWYKFVQFTVVKCLYQVVWLDRSEASIAKQQSINHVLWHYAVVQGKRYIGVSRFCMNITVLQGAS